MHWFGRLTVLLSVVAGSLALGGCTDPNEAPRITASIEAFTATPQVIVSGESSVLRWHATDVLTFRLSANYGDVMPDDSQPWSCARQGNSQVCTAPDARGGDGWNCSDGECRRSYDADEEGWVPLDVMPSAIPIGSFAVAPDRTTTYRLEVEGNGGSTAVAWVQVVVGSEGAARVVSWTAWPTPALVGEEVVLTYHAEGCDQVEYSAWPPIPYDEIYLCEGDSGEPPTCDDYEPYDEERGAIVWVEADETRDFYFACHPEGDAETARVRSHITVPVILMPEVCERIDNFSAIATGSGYEDTDWVTYVEVNWSVSNATSVTGGADPVTPSRPQFYVGSAVFEGTWSGWILADTTFSISALGVCRGAEASVTVEAIPEE